MLSIAPAPDFESSGRVYVTYTGTTQAGGAEGDIHLDSFRPNPAGGAVRSASRSSASATNRNHNHNGGQLQWGPDGHLYMSLGDGGGSGDPFENGQDTKELLGKILRIDPHPGQAPAYSIPAGNPFAGTRVAPRSGPTGCATPGASPSTGPPATWRSAMSDRTPARRSMSRRARPPGWSAAPERTTAGTAVRASSPTRPRDGVLNREWLRRTGLRLPALRSWRGRRLRLFDHRRLRRPRPQPRRPLRSLPLHRLLFGRDSLPRPATQRRSRRRRSLRGAHGQKADLVRRRLLWAGLRRFQGRTGLPLRRSGSGDLSDSGIGSHPVVASNPVVGSNHAALGETQARSPAALGQAPAARRLALRGQGPARPVPEPRRPARSAESRRQELRQQTPRSPLPGTVLAHRR